MSTLQERRQARSITQQNKTLAELHPELASRIAHVLQDLQSLGWDPVALGGWRSLSQQASLRAEGKSSVSFSFHNVTDAEGNPLSMAVHVIDRGLGPQTKDNKDHPFWQALQKVGAQYGLTTGRNWKKPSKDVAHVQLYPNKNLGQIKNWVNEGSVGPIPSLPPMIAPNTDVKNSSNWARSNLNNPQQYSLISNMKLPSIAVPSPNTAVNNSSNWARSRFNDTFSFSGNRPSGGQPPGYTGGSLCITIHGMPGTRTCFPFDFSTSGKKAGGKP